MTDKNKEIKPALKDYLQYCFTVNPSYAKNHAALLAALAGKGWSPEAVRQVRALLYPYSSATDLATKALGELHEVFECLVLDPNACMTKTRLEIGDLLVFAWALAMASGEYPDELVAQAMKKNLAKGVEDVVRDGKAGKGLREWWAGRQGGAGETDETRETKQGPPK